VSDIERETSDGWVVATVQGHPAADIGHGRQRAGMWACGDTGRLVGPTAI
jgi:hypothetical protein